ncbi:hypothetical protein [Methylomonas sp. LW13]|uniref:hypothetical protein n=1 Tax=Methylomonas sp. WH-1 TaxID=2815719 RepID=UPI0013EE5060
MTALTLVKPLAGMGMVSVLRHPHSGQISVDSKIILFMVLPLLASKYIRRRKSTQHGFESGFSRIEVHNRLTAIGVKRRVCDPRDPIQSYFLDRSDHAG